MEKVMLATAEDGRFDKAQGKVIPDVTKKRMEDYRAYLRETEAFKKKYGLKRVPAACSYRLNSEAFGSHEIMTGVMIA